MHQHEPSEAVAGRPLEERLEELIGGREGPAIAHLRRVLHQLSQLDRAVYAAIAATPSPELDVPVRRLSRLADKSRIWFGIAAGMAVFGGPAGRRAAARGVVTVGVTSAVVNIGIKHASRRRRPDRAGLGVPRVRQVGMPSSRSFPSGHSASAFAFAAAVSQDVPSLALPLRLLAGAVAYSRVHTGVHYPGDVLIGSILGAGIAQTVSGPTGHLLDLPRLTALGTTRPPAGRPRRRAASRRSTPT